MAYRVIKMLANRAFRENQLSGISTVQRKKCNASEEEHPASH